MDNNNRPNHIEDYLAQLHTGQWFGWSDINDKVYVNLVIYDDTKTKPTEQECNDGLTQIQNTYDNAITKKETDSASGKTKLKELGLNDDEIQALIGK